MNDVFYILKCHCSGEYLRIPGDNWQCKGCGRKVSGDAMLARYQLALGMAMKSFDVIIEMLSQEGVAYPQAASSAFVLAVNRRREIAAGK